MNQHRNTTSIALRRHTFTHSHVGKLELQEERYAPNGGISHVRSSPEVRPKEEKEKGIMAIRIPLSGTCDHSQPRPLRLHFTIRYIHLHHLPRDRTRHDYRAIHRYLCRDAPHDSPLAGHHWAPTDGVFGSRSGVARSRIPGFPHQIRVPDASMKIPRPRPSTINRRPMERGCPPHALASTVGYRGE